MVSSCCGSNVQDPGGTGEWLCMECWENCTDEPEEVEEEKLEQAQKKAPKRWKKLHSFAVSD